MEGDLWWAQPKLPPRALATLVSLPRGTHKAANPSKSTKELRKAQARVPAGRTDSTSKAWWLWVSKEYHHDSLGGVGERQSPTRFQGDHCSPASQGLSRT
jgi:hypothetical protein